MAKEKFENETILEPFTDDELKAELERRAKPKLKVPCRVAVADWKPLLKACKNYISFVASGEYNDDVTQDYRMAIYEAALEATYGKDIWQYIRQAMTRADQV